MAASTSPTHRRRRLARRLRQLRESAGFTQEEAARALDKTRSALVRVESGESRADVHLVRSMMDLYDIRDDELLDLAREAAKKGWWRPYSPEELGYVGIETEACRVLELSVLNVPGLLQTEAYFRAAMAAANLPRTPEVADNQVAVRQIRQQRLTDDDHPLELVAIIDEAVLHRAVGGPDVMREQLARLVEASAMPRVTLQVVPFGAGFYSAMNGAFIVLEFPEADDPDVLYLAHVSGALHVEKDADVRNAKVVHERLRSLALPPAESTALVARLSRNLYP